MYISPDPEWGIDIINPDFFPAVYVDQETAEFYDQHLLETAFPYEGSFGYPQYGVAYSEHDKDLSQRFSDWTKVAVKIHGEMRVNPRFLTGQELEGSFMLPVGGKNYTFEVEV